MWPLVHVDKLERHASGRGAAGQGSAVQLLGMGRPAAALRPYSWCPCRPPLHTLLHVFFLLPQAPPFLTHSPHPLLKLCSAPCPAGSGECCHREEPPPHATKKNPLQAMAAHPLGPPALPTGPSLSPSLPISPANPYNPPDPPCPSILTILQAHPVRQSLQSFPPRPSRVSPSILSSKPHVHCPPPEA